MSRNGTAAEGSPTLFIAGLHVVSLFDQVCYTTFLSMLSIADSKLLRCLHKDQPQFGSPKSAANINEPAASLQLCQRDQ